MQVTGKIENIRRLINTPDGNPRFEITIEGRVYQTKANISDAYAVQNPGLREGNTATAVLDRHNRITKFVGVK